MAWPKKKFLSFIKKFIQKCVSSEKSLVPPKVTFWTHILLFSTLLSLSQSQWPPLWPSANTWGLCNHRLPYSGRLSPRNLQSLTPYFLSISPVQCGFSSLVAKNGTHLQHTHTVSICFPLLHFSLWHYHIYFILFMYLVLHLSPSWALSFGGGSFFLFWLLPYPQY